MLLPHLFFSPVFQTEIGYPFSVLQLVEKKHIPYFHILYSIFYIRYIRRLTRRYLDRLGLTRERRIGSSTGKQPFRIMFRFHANGRVSAYITCFPPPPHPPFFPSTRVIYERAHFPTADSPLPCRANEIRKRSRINAGITKGVYEIALRSRHWLCQPRTAARTY